MSPEIIEVKYALDTFYFLIAGAFVMWMAAGFAMLEAGLVRAKNTTEILTKNVALFAVACTMYLFVGYTIMYGGSAGGFLPDGWFGNSIANASLEEVLASDGDTYYSGASDFFFQVVFVATAMSIVSGAVAERMKLWAFLIFAVVMTGVIYPIQGMWTWGGGFLSDARKGKYGANGQINAIPGANMPLATLGTFILWMGWFGFNGGSELVVSDVSSANNVASVFVNTNASACGGLIAALLLGHILFGKADLTMALNGALAGLVAITAGPLAPSPVVATLIGAIGGIIVVFSIVGLDKMKIDDPVGAISVHGVVGIWGVLAVPFTNSDASWGSQIYGIVAIFLWVFVMSLIVWGIIKVAMGIRVSEQAEYEGVDVSECGIEAYPEFTKS